ncbi:hypothetical protein [Rhodoferax koreensis]|nr:hypothetical protein [Rhodoferax koreense]
MDPILTLAALGYAAIIVGIYSLARSYYKLPPEDRVVEDEDRR